MKNKSPRAIPPAFTPGPWEATKREWDSEWRVSRLGLSPVAKTEDGNDNAESDALLISAAPDLLAALSALLPIASFGADYLEQPANDGRKGAQKNYDLALDAIAKAQTAIRKAEGGK